jgi:hypothetical protein
LVTAALPHGGQLSRRVDRQCIKAWRDCARLTGQLGFQQRAKARCRAKTDQQCALSSVDGAQRGRRGGESDPWAGAAGEEDGGDLYGLFLLFASALWCNAAW